LGFGGQRLQEAAPAWFKYRRRPPDTALCEKRRLEPALRRAGRMQFFGVRTIMDKAPQATAKAGGYSQRRGALRRVQLQQRTHGRCGAKYATAGG